MTKTQVGVERERERERERDADFAVWRTECGRHRRHGIPSPPRRTRAGTPSPESVPSRAWTYPRAIVAGIVAFTVAVSIVGCDCAPAGEPPALLGGCCAPATPVRVVGGMRCCLGPGASCATAGQCCGGSSLTCGPAGACCTTGVPATCRADNECCAPNRCASGSCCGGDGASCASDGACCGGMRCFSGQCRACSGSGSACWDGADCCAGLLCSTNMRPIGCPPGVPNDPICGGPPTGVCGCAPNGSRPRPGQPCCSGNPADPMTGTCCAGRGDVARASDDCCASMMLVEVGGVCAPCVPPGGTTATRDDQCCQPAVIVAGACLTITPNGSPCGAATAPCVPTSACCPSMTGDVCRDVRSDVNNCGACGNVCPSGPGATAVCAAGACSITCLAGFANCDGIAGNGCETMLGTVANCSACGDSCRSSPPNAISICHSTLGTRSCGLACNFGWADCDLDPRNGCERNLLTDPMRCGGCGILCPSGNSCINGRCVVPGSCGLVGDTCGVAASTCCVGYVCDTPSAHCTCTAAGATCDPRRPENNFGCCPGLNCGPSTRGYVCTTNCALHGENCERRQCCAGRGDVCSRNDMFEVVCDAPSGCVAAGALCRTDPMDLAGSPCCMPFSTPQPCPADNFCPAM